MVDFDSDEFLEKMLTAHEVSKNKIELNCKAQTDGWLKVYSDYDEDDEANESYKYLEIKSEKAGKNGKYRYTVSKKCPKDADENGVATNSDYLHWYKTVKFYQDGMVCGRAIETSPFDTHVALADKITRSGWIWLLSWVREPKVVYVTKPVDGEPEFDKKNNWYIYEFQPTFETPETALFPDSPATAPQVCKNYQKPMGKVTFYLIMAAIILFLLYKMYSLVSGF